MTTARLRLVLAIVALVLAAAAALVRTPAPAHDLAARKTPVFKPASGC